MLRMDVVVGRLGVVEADAVVERHRQEGAELLGVGKPEQLGEEVCRLLAVLAATMVWLNVMAMSIE